MADADREASKAALARNAAVVAGRTGRALVVPAVAAALAVTGGVFVYFAVQMMDSVDGGGNNPELAIQASTALLYAAVALWSVAALCVTVDIAVTRLARRPQPADA